MDRADMASRMLVLPLPLGPVRRMGFEERERWRLWKFLKALRVRERRAAAGGVCIFRIA